MDIDKWWPVLRPETRTWLIENNGDDLTDDIASEILEKGGSAVAGSPLTDDQVDWIETVANDEEE